MTATRQRVRVFLAMFDDMSNVFSSEASWKAKHDLVLSIAEEMRAAGFCADYANPDTTYEEDATACYRAWAELAAEYRAAFRAS